MITTFPEALKELGPDAAFRFSREARPTSDYYLTSFLPEMNKPGYSVESGNMTIYATMAGQAGMDSPYPEGGKVSASKFLKKTAKIANQVTIPEEVQRELQEFQARMALGNTSDTMNLVETTLNFVEKLIVQPHWDTFEFLKGQIFTTGKIDWTFNKLNINVDYGIPDGNKLPVRSGSDAYHGTSSKFWDDIWAMQEKLYYDVEAYFCHPTTMKVALNNKANDIKILNRRSYKYGAEYEITRYTTNAGNTIESSDFRDSVTIRTYGMEGTLIDPTDPKETINKPFVSAGKLVAVGGDEQRGFRINEGSTDDVARDRVLGYTHIGPTTEGNGQMGRWSRVRVPDDMPMQLQGQGVTNGLPVVEAPEKIVIATTDMPS